MKTLARQVQGRSVESPLVQEQAKRLSKARRDLVLDTPWFGTLSLRLRFVCDPSTQTMATNGTVLKWSPAFVATVSDRVLKTIVAHEVAHCAFLHPYRCAGKNQKVWNIACDHVVNLLLRENGFELWPHGCQDARFRGMGAEQVYAILRKEQQEKGDQGGEQGDGPVQPGEVEAPEKGKGDEKGEDQGEGTDGEPSDEEGETGGVEGKESSEVPIEPMTEQDWAIAAEQAAMVTRRAGRMGGTLDRAIGQAREPQVDWLDVCREFVVQNIVTDADWSVPNRRFIAQGMYLPGNKRENTATLGIGLDTSGSVSQPELDTSGSEVTNLVQEARPESIRVVYCDTRLHPNAEGEVEDVFTPDDEIVFRARGGGGTNLKVAFDHFNENPPAALIFFTDTYTDWRSIKEPEYPVLLVLPAHATNQAPDWARVVQLPAR
jgi:predicted metal-dependent peptidase